MRRKPAFEPAPRLVDINGRPGLMLIGTDGDLALLSFAVEGGRITRIHAVRNPDKLRRVRENG